MKNIEHFLPVMLVVVRCFYVLEPMDEILSIKVWPLK